MATNYFQPHCFYYYYYYLFLYFFIIFHLLPRPFGDLICEDQATYQKFILGSKVLCFSLETLYSWLSFSILLISLLIIITSIVLGSKPYKCVNVATYQEFIFITYYHQYIYIYIFIYIEAETLCESV